MLVARSQHPHESVQKFASDIRQLAKLAQPGWTGYDEHDFVKSHFISKLLPHIRIWVRNASPKTFEDAVQEAYKQEVNLGSDISANIPTVSVGPNVLNNMVTSFANLRLQDAPLLSSSNQNHHWRKSLNFNQKTRMES